MFYAACLVERCAFLFHKGGICNDCPKSNQMLLPDPFCDLSLEERGVLATMINRQDADYVTAEKLTTLSRDSIQTVQAALDDLVTKGYLLQDGQIYIVNKLRLTMMR